MNPDRIILNHTVVKAFILLFCLTPICATQATVNPFFEDWNTPFESPEFSKIQLIHFEPALEHGMKKTVGGD
jgi:peptidyl-dipeptidase Dcp